MEALFRRGFERLNFRIEQVDELLKVAVHETSERRALIQHRDKERTGAVTRMCRCGDAPAPLGYSAR